MFKHYVYIARPDHWFKNIFMLPGMIMGLYYLDFQFDWKTVPLILAGILATCFIASANYVINEWLDMESDRFHPVKKNRPAVKAGLKAPIIYTEYALLAVAGLGLSYLVSYRFLFTELLFLLMGFIYNVKYNH